MLSYTVYKLLHLMGVFMILLSLGGLILLNALPDGSRSPWKKLAGMTNGIGLIIVLVAGFGMLARLDSSWPWPGWVVSKLLIWLAFGASVAVANRLPQTTLIWWGYLFLATLAGYLALFKPFA